MEFDWVFYAVTIPAVLFAGVSKGGFGSAAAFAAAPFMALVLEPEAAVAIMLPLLIVMDFTAVRVYWRKWDPAAAKLLVLGGLPGAVLGAALILVANPDVFRFLIGAISVSFVIWQFAQSRGWIQARSHPLPRRAGILLGTGAGFTSFIAHAGGPLTAVYLLTQNLSKVTYQATTVVVFWINNLVKLALYIWLGILGWETGLVGLYLFPVAIFGTYLGIWLNGIVPEKLYFAFTYICLMLAGTKLIFDALF